MWRLDRCDMPAHTKNMRALRRIEIAAWIGGLALFAAYGGVRVWAEFSRASGVAAVLQAREHSLDANGAPAPRLSSSAPDMSSWSRSRIAAYASMSERPKAPQAVLRIPAVKLDVPVFEGTSEANLNRGAGHIQGTARIGDGGNVGIAAHRDGFFRALQHVHVGDALYLDTLGGTLAYRVVRTSIVEPSAVGVLDDTKEPTITLVTCYPFYFVGPAPQRFIVRARMQSH